VDEWVAVQRAALGLAPRQDDDDLPSFVGEVDEDGLVADAEEMAQEVSELARFNPNHAPPGSAAGGQFTTGGGGPGGRSDAPGTATRKRRLHREAAHLREQARELAAQIAGLVKELRGAARASKAAKATHAASKRAAASAAKGAKAAKNAKPGQNAAKAKAKTVHHRAAQSAAAKAAGRVVVLHKRILGLRHRIRELRAQADRLDAKANSL
jgi:hypothetical protein